MVYRDEKLFLRNPWFTLRSKFQPHSVGNRGLDNLLKLRKIESENPCYLRLPDHFEHIQGSFKPKRAHFNWRARRLTRGFVGRWKFSPRNVAF